LFNLESFDIKLDTDYIGRNFIYTEVVDSTNEELLKQDNYKLNGTVFFSEKQNKGKGRKDRVWLSNKEQNLTFSIMLTDKKLFTKNLNLINFASSLSVAFSIENLYQLKTELKWPNDVLINGNKTAGILLESSSKGKKVENVVVGIGVNVNQNSFQEDFKIEPTSIRLELKQVVDRESLLAEILNNFEENLGKIITDPKWIMNEWKLKCKMIGEKISVSEGKQIKYGIFEDIDDDGFLLLKSGSKVEKIYLGDVGII
jgi:BirA family transcriptional regulator, biotin operon repressor / biotin---[acetyl-CoA-carboxylase] ligase